VGEHGTQEGGRGEGRGGGAGAAGVVEASVGMGTACHPPPVTLRLWAGTAVHVVAMVMPQQL